MLTTSVAGAVAIGAKNTSTGNGALALGNSNTATGQGSVALGNNSSVATAGGVAIGDTASASGTNAVALGSGASAGFAGSTAVGVGAKTTATNQVMIGTSGTSYVAPGIGGASTAAQSGSTNFVTADTKGTLGVSTYGPSDIASLNSSVASLSSGQSGQQAQINALANVQTIQQQQIYSLQKAVDRAYSDAAIAMASIPGYLPENKNFAVSAHYGEFNGQNAFGASAMVRVSEQLVLDDGVGVGIGNAGGAGVRAGGTFAW